jgi:hypothetical protein
MTFVEIVNKVLIRLREDTVSSYNETAYSTLISEFVNQIKKEVEDSWDWSMLRQTVAFTTSASTNTYTMDGVTSDVAMGERFKIFNVVDDTNDTQLHKVDYSWLKKHNLQGTQQESQPSRYMLTGASSGNPILQLYPIPDGAYDIYIHAKIPQDDISVSGTVVQVPHLPVILGAYAMAIAERGEEGSTSFDRADLQYRQQLADAISFDAANYPSETMWYPA